MAADLIANDLPSRLSFKYSLQAYRKVSSDTAARYDTSNLT